MPGTQLFEFPDKPLKLAKAHASLESHHLWTWGFFSVTRNLLNRDVMSRDVGTCHEWLLMVFYFDYSFRVLTVIYALMSTHWRFYGGL